MNYAERLRESELLRRLPLEYTFRRQPVDAFLNRLVTENNLFADVIRHPSSEPIVSLVVPVTRDALDKLAVTLQAFDLQSCPFVECIVTVMDPSLKKELKSFVVDLRLANTPIVVCETVRWLDFTRGRYVIFAGPGDIFHPSLATVVATTAMKQDIDVLVWNTQYLSGSADSFQVAAFFRRPQLEIETLRHVDYIGLNFAVARRLVVEHGRVVTEAATRLDCHLFLLWLASSPHVAWHTHPEYLALTPEGSPEQVPGKKFARSEKEYRSVFRGLERDFEFLRVESSDEQPYRLRPKRRAESISIVIPFRDKPAHTIRCLESVFRQRTFGRLDVVLVDNCSSPATLSSIEEFVRTNCRQEIVSVVHYSMPFNHSRQCNRGIDESKGEVVVLLNNDTELVQEDVLDEMAAWALRPGVGTVGCRIMSEADVLVCAGIKTRLNPGNDYNSSWEESKDPRYSNNVRECVANSFACAAISRTSLGMVGLLNDAEFPNGYNDLEFCLRARKKGLKHIYLGQHVVRHEPGTSRGKCDELYQKLLLRERFPESLADGLFQLGYENHLLKNARTAKLPSESLGRIREMGVLKRLLGRR